jgi:hypothetical protein
MRLLIGSFGLLVVAAIAGFAFWPGLVTALESFILLFSIDSSGAGAIADFLAPLMAYAVVAAATFILFFVTVQKLTEDR